MATPLAEGAFHVREVDDGVIIDLRQRVLRPGLPRDLAMFAGDELPTSHHFAAIDGGGAVIGCATFHLNEHDGEPAWQLRGMATDPAWHGRGVGRRVLTAGEAAVVAVGPQLLWCNAREGALGFYQRLGWATCSDRFDIPLAGPHFRMRKRA